MTELMETFISSVQAVVPPFDRWAAPGYHASLRSGPTCGRFLSEEETEARSTHHDLALFWKFVFEMEELPAELGAFLLNHPFLQLTDSKKVSQPIREHGARCQCDAS